MTLDEIRTYLTTDFPQVFREHDVSLVSAEEGRARIALTPGTQHLRPGGIVSGPTLMMLADAAAYVALLSLTERAKMAVTTNLSVSFVRGVPAGTQIVQDARVLKAGRRLCVIVCEALNPTASGAAAILAHTSVSYAMPA